MGGAASSDAGSAKGFVLGHAVFGREGLSVHNAKAGDGSELLVALLHHDPTPSRTAAFESAVRHAEIGGLRFEKVDSLVAVARGSAVGTVEHLPGLGWRLGDRVKLFFEIAKLADRYHAHGQSAGSLDPDYILLDDQFKPMLLGPGFAPTEGLYTAPDKIENKWAGQRADIYSLGRLLHFLLTQKAPPVPPRKDPTKLADLVSYPAGLSRIVRKAIQPFPEDRYLSVTDLLNDLNRYGRYEEVGLVHPEVKEINLGGLSFGPSAPMPQEHAHETTEKLIEQIAAADLQNIQPFKLRPSTRSLLVVLGMLCVFTAFGINYLAGSPLWVQVVLSLSAGLVGFALLSPGIERESRSRTIFAIFFASAMFGWNPTPYFAQLAERMGLQSPHATKRAESLVRQAHRGHTEFQGANMKNAKLKGEIFPYSNFENVSFEGADLTDAKFMSAKLDGAKFKGATIYGAWFQSCSLDHVVDFDSAKCDEATKFSGDWVCANGYPSRQSSSSGSSKAHGAKPTPTAVGPTASRPEAPAAPKDEAARKAEEALNTPLFDGEKSMLDEADSNLETAELP